MDANPLDIDREAWLAFGAEERRLRSAKLSIEDKLRLGQRLSAHAAALRRSSPSGASPADAIAMRNIDDELPIDPIPGLDT